MAMNASQAFLNDCRASDRLLAEVRALEENPVPGCFAFPREENPMMWTVVVSGPENTPYEGGTFFIQLAFEFQYPYVPPSVLFLTRIFHHSIDPHNHCDLPLFNRWKPCHRISDILQSIVELLKTDPPFKTHKELVTYRKTAREWTKRYAT